jgi:hypothetical protein
MPIRICGLAIGRAAYGRVEAKASCKSARKVGWAVVGPAAGARRAADARRLTAVKPITAVATAADATNDGIVAAVDRPSGYISRTSHFGHDFHGIVPDFVFSARSGRSA